MHSTSLPCLLTGTIHLLKVDPDIPAPSPNWNQTFTLGWPHFRSNHPIPDQIVNSSARLSWDIFFLHPDWVGSTLFFLHRNWVESPHFFVTLVPSNTYDRVKLRILTHTLIMLIKQENSNFELTHLLAPNSLFIWNRGGCWSRSILYIL